MAVSEIWEWSFDPSRASPAAAPIVLTDSLPVFKRANTWSGQQIEQLASQLEPVPFKHNYDQRGRRILDSPSPRTAARLQVPPCRNRIGGRVSIALSGQAADLVAVGLARRHGASDQQREGGSHDPCGPGTAGTTHL